MTDTEAIHLAEERFAQAVEDLTHAAAIAELQDGYAVLDSNLRIVGFSREWGRANEAAGNRGYVVRIPYGADLEEYEIKATLIAGISERLVTNGTHADQQIRDHHADRLEFAVVDLLRGVR